MTSLRIIRLSLFVTACACGMSAFAARGGMVDNEILPQLAGELQHMPLDRHDNKFCGFCEAMSRAFVLEHKQQQQWLERQWVELSPEERDLLHRQVIEYWQRMTPEQRQRMHELHQKKPDPAGDNNPGPQEYRSQRLSPEERQEFHHWMRGRRGEPS